MESRMIRLNARCAGGNAGKNSFKYSADIPSSWIKQLNMSTNDKFTASLEDETIVLRKKAPSDPDAFLYYAQQLGHKVTIFQFYDKDVLCSTIAADFTSQQVAVHDTVKEPERQAFGVNKDPTWEDSLSFLEDRCIPRTRVGIDKYLHACGIDSYDVFSLIRCTEGRMAEDNQWIKEMR